MRKAYFWLAALLVVVGTTTPAKAQAPDKPAKKRLLLVTHSGGFIHGSVATAEETLKQIGPANGFDVTCWRFTEDTDKKVKGKDAKERTALEAYSERFRGSTKLTVEKENCGRINKDTLKNFDVVLFFTTGNPMTKDELADLKDWVRNGGAVAGTHCATDTLYGESVYGDLIGAYFKGHPPGLQKIKVKVEDAKHPAAAGFENGMDYQDEMYVFRDVPYSREKLHIILSIDASSFNPGNNLARGDKDYAISWCREEGKGKVFYTSFGHDPKVWKDPKFQQHLFGGLKWVTGQSPGDAAPSSNSGSGR